MRENNLWNWLRKSWRTVRGLHAQRIETLTMSGVPDVEVCCAGLSFWLELKAVDRPARDSTPVDTELTMAQGLWHRRRNLAGGTSFVLVTVGSGRSRRNYLIPGTEARNLVRTPVIEADLAKLSLCPPTVGPLEILRIMMELTSRLTSGV